MGVCLLCVLTGRGLCDKLITRPEESYQLWCFVVCDLETWWMRRPWPTGGCRAKNKLNNATKRFYISYMYIHVSMYILCMYVCLYIHTVHLRYNLSASLQEHCDLPKIIIVIRPINHEKKNTAMLYRHSPTYEIVRFRRSDKIRILRKSKLSILMVNYVCMGKWIRTCKAAQLKSKFPYWNMSGHSMSAPPQVLSPSSILPQLSYHDAFIPTR